MPGLTRTSLTLIAVVMLTGQISATPPEPPPAKIQDAAWIAGHWQGQALGGSCDEYWSKPLAGSMMGMFRLIKNDKIVFYEFFRLAEENGTLTLKLKHFHPELKGWEEKDATVDFPLISIGPDELIFEGMTFRRNSPDSVTVTVQIGNRATGSTREEKFRYTKAKD